MRHVKLTLDYIAKNLVFVAVLAFVPAMMFSLSAKSVGIFDFFWLTFENAFWEPTSFTFWEAYQRFSFVFSSNFPGSVIPLLAGIFAVGIFISFVLRHLRYNTKSVGSIRARLLDSIMVVFPVMLFFLVSAELVALGTVGVLIFFEWMMSAKGFFFASTIVVFVIYFIFLNFWTKLMFWIPVVLLDGYRHNVAAGYSSRLNSKCKGTLLFEVLVMMILPLLLSFAAQYFGGSVTAHVARTFFSTYFIVVVPIFICITYFDVNEIKRGDKK